MFALYHKKAVSLLPTQGFEFFCPISLVDLGECGLAAPNSDGSSCPGRLDKLPSLNLNLKIDGEHVQKRLIRSGMPLINSVLPSICFLIFRELSPQSVITSSTRFPITATFTYLT